MMIVAAEGHFQEGYFALGLSLIRHFSCIPLKTELPLRLKYVNHILITDMSLELVNKLSFFILIYCFYPNFSRQMFKKRDDENNLISINKK